MLQAYATLSCEVKEASVRGECRVVMTVRGKGTLDGYEGRVRGKLTFVPRNVSPPEADCLGSRIAHRLIEDGSEVVLRVGIPACRPEA